MSGNGNNGVTRVLLWAALCTVIVCNGVVAATVAGAMRTIAEATTAWRGVEEIRSEYEHRITQLEIQTANAMQNHQTNSRRLTALEGEK